MPLLHLFVRNDNGDNASFAEVAGVAAQDKAPEAVVTPLIGVAEASTTVACPEKEKKYMEGFEQAML